MREFYNPSVLHAGLLVPPYVLSAKVSHGAKLMYPVLVEAVDRDGEALAHVTAVARRLRERESRVLEFLSELEKEKLLIVRWLPADRKSFRCLFRLPSSLKKVFAEGEGSRFSKEICREYAESRIALGQRIENVHRFANYLYSTGRQDEEIERYLEEKRRASEKG
jgi:hypothetical protein